MDFPKYNGNVHPDEWIKDLQNYLEFYKPIKDSNEKLTRSKFALSLVDSNILLPTEIDSIVKLRKALKEDISFTIFKNTNKRKLQSLNYIPERKGGDTSKFISNFLKLCYNAEINDIEEQKNYLYKSLPMNSYFSNEFYKKMKNTNSINESIKEFEDIVFEESNLIKWKSETVFVGGPEPDPNSLWKIKFGNELITYADTSIRFQHVKPTSNNFLGIDSRCTSPSTNYTEVSSCNNCYSHWHTYWNFNHSKLENYQGYLKSNDIINISIKKFYDRYCRYIKNGQVEFLRSHDIQFTIGNNTYQEVVCHNERLGGNDEWCIELIKQHTEP
ncbi:hypothetical protein RhiirC2_331011 [Rhizophagus irregularis]|uniref:MIR domain-containing protein n=1 Tax=Rhizophagus irregularis TaxID=588596 RepID=A0A2N1NIB2_9GLOM|nr:hypothetical protein RhiirC2_331011 [Rhizophagus irregularis]